MGFLKFVSYFNCFYFSMAARSPILNTTDSDSPVHVGLVKPVGVDVISFLSSPLLNENSIFLILFTEDTVIVFLHMHASLLHFCVPFRRCRPYAFIKRNRDFPIFYSTNRSWVCRKIKRHRLFRSIQIADGSNQRKQK